METSFPNVNSLIILRKDFQRELARKGIAVRKKFRRGSTEVDGLSYFKDGQKFKASQVDRNGRCSYDVIYKAVKDKYGLTYLPLKQKYEDRIPVFKERINQAIYGCKSWDEFPRRLACAGIEVKFHDDHNSGKHIGVKFTDGDITINGSKIDRTFTYLRLNNLFDFNRRQGFE